ncbi:AMP-binding protein [Nonomuraea sp. NPDC003804]|uniref:AMP-binding protein n=1 Tax=Nonomuraea sp. NPDC003804 TaxID=3154547 RepID=UPI0033A16733
MDPFPHPHASLVVAETQDVLGADELTARIADAARKLAAAPPGPLFLGMRNDLPSVLAYLAALRSGRPVALLDPALPAAVLADLTDRFAPAAVAGFQPTTAGFEPAAVAGFQPTTAGFEPTAVAGFQPTTAGFEPTAVAGFQPTTAGCEPAAVAGFAVAHRPRPRAAPDPHPDLAVLLTTSGSTGNPKLVRLSHRAVMANARAIAQALRLTPADVAPTSLPLHYSYGLSVLNSHLAAGATIVLTGASLLERPFWRQLAEHRCTSLAGVPYQYEMLRRLRFDPAAHPALTTLTQAGGRLRPELVAEFAAKVDRFFVMYGQTEATARIAVLPPERLPDKLGSAGVALPGGALGVENGEIVYRGPNVMMGYATSAADLARGDDLGGVLRTGDLGYVDEEGFLFVTGRVKRIAKVYGVRVNLDDVERLLRDCGPVAATGGDDRVTVWTEGLDRGAREALARRLAGELRLHWSGFDVREVDRLPLLATGKIDYRALEARA